MNYKYVLLLDRAYLLKSLDELESHGYNPDKDMLYELGRKIRVTYQPKIEEVVSAPRKVEVESKLPPAFAGTTWGRAHGK